jgi:hypothetical protein
VEKDEAESAAAEEKAPAEPAASEKDEAAKEGGES